METIFKNPSWWNRRTRLEKKLLIATLIAVILISILVTVYVFVINTPQKNEPDICITEECTYAAARIVSAFDKNVLPCDDFYKFTCGNFLNSTIIPEDESQVTAFSLTNNHLNTQLYSMLNEPNEKDEIFPFVLAKKYFKACMDVELIERMGITPILKTLTNLGGWPVLEGKRWNERTFNWTAVIKKLHHIGNQNSAMFSYAVTTDVKNVTTRILNLDEANLYLERENLLKGLDDEIVRAYYDFMVDIAIIFGADNDTAEREMKDVLKFQISLANHTLPREDRRNEHLLYKIVTLGDMNRKYGYLNWVSFFNDILPPSVTVRSDEPVWLVVPKFYEQLGHLLRTTPKRTIANHIIWTGIYTITDYLTQEIRDREFVFNKVQSGLGHEKPRWKQCVSHTKSMLSEAIGALYIRRFFKEADKLAAVEMVNDIRIVFTKILNNVDWMDDKTREIALAKSSTMTQHVGYPNELMNDTAIIEYYKTYVDPSQITSDSFFEITLQLVRGHYNISFGKLRKPNVKNEWHDHADAAVINGLYSFEENSIEFPAGILQGQFFSSDRPRYLNYAGIGVGVGHEITHGFDDQGRQYDENGKLFEWWQESTRKAFLEKAKCIIDQYGNITEPLTGLTLNGINTQGENIADNGGVKIAYLAYKKFLERNGVEKSLPNLGQYTSEQMFWISYGRTWCAALRPETMKNRLIADPHSPPNIRVSATLKNMKYFSDDFQCPLGSPMNPVEKCEFW